MYLLVKQNQKEKYILSKRLEGKKCALQSLITLVNATVKIKNKPQDFPGGPVVKSLPGSVRDIGSIARLERFRMLRSLSKRSCHNEKPICCNQKVAPTCCSQRNPCPAVKSQHSHKQVNHVGGKKDVCQGKNLSPQKSKSTHDNQFVKS